MEYRERRAPLWGGVEVSHFFLSTPRSTSQLQLQFMYLHLAHRLSMIIYSLLLPAAQPPRPAPSWSPADEARLAAIIASLGTGDWQAVASLLSDSDPAPVAARRVWSAAECRERWRALRVEHAAEAAMHPQYVLPPPAPFQTQSVFTVPVAVDAAPASAQVQPAVSSAAPAFASQTQSPHSHSLSHSHHTVGARSSGPQPQPLPQSSGSPRLV